MRQLSWGLLAALGAGCAPSARVASPHWSYVGTDGPAQWGGLSPDFDLCKAGAQQSPIDLPPSAEPDHAGPLVFAYQAFPLSVVNNGHALQIDVASGSTVTVGPTATDRYELVQFHFHSPSEHTLAGRASELELHLVHRNASGHLLVVSLLFDKGNENPALAPIFALAPSEVGRGSGKEGGARVDPGTLVPASSGYFHYTGSLTTPPCSEGVAWYVMSTHGEVSEAQIARYRALFHGGTNRPVQPQGGRSIVQYRP
jgi:carbonic anhydrase